MLIILQTGSLNHWVVRAHGGSAGESLAAVQWGDTSSVIVADGRTMARKSNADGSAEFFGSGNQLKDNFKGAKSAQGDVLITYGDGTVSNKIPFEK